MSTYVVIALSPVVDVSTVVGPFRSWERANQASDELRVKGYNTEICPVGRLDEIEESPAWDGES